MGRTRLKRLLALAGAAVVAVALVVVLLGAGLLERSVNEGADPADAFTEVPEGVTALDGVVVWLPDGPLQERAVEPATRLRVEAAWTRAWEALQRAATGDPSLVDAWFAGPALAQVEAMARTQGQVPVALSFGEHRLRIDFYSDDGAVLGLRADPVRLVRTVETPAGPVATLTDETIDVVMVLEDGNWRIRQWTRTAVVEVDPGS